MLATYVLLEAQHTLIQQLNAIITKCFNTIAKLNMTRFVKPSTYTHNDKVQFSLLIDSFITKS